MMLLVVLQAHVRRALPTPWANRPDVAYLVQATPHPLRRTLDRTTDPKPPSPDSSSSSSSSNSTRMRFLPSARIGPTSLMSFRLLPFPPDEPSIVLPTPPPPDSSSSSSSSSPPSNSLSLSLSLSSEESLSAQRDSSAHDSSAAAPSTEYFASGSFMLRVLPSVSRNTLKS